MNLISLHSLIRDEDSAKEYLKSKDILKRESMCPKCSEPMTKEIKRRNFSFFRCSKCQVEESIRKRTFLFNKVIF